MDKIEELLKAPNEEKNELLFELPKAMPEEFLERGAISQRRYEKSPHDPTAGRKKKLFSEIPHLHGKRVELRELRLPDAPALAELTGNPDVYRYLPTFLFEKKYDAQTVIERLYSEAWKDSIILGVFMDADFCGLAEMYGFRDPIHKISVGYRLLERCWGQGIATESLGLMVDYLYGETDIEIITASTMVENQASANVLMKNGFSLVSHAVGEDWGYGSPTIADKWIR